MKKNIFKIIDIIMLFLYAFIIIAVLLSVCSVKYFYVLPKDVGSLWVCVIFVIVLPALAGVGSVVIKSEKIRWKVCQAFIKLVVLVGAMIYATIFLLGGICSYTTDVADYHKFDTVVLKDMEDDKSLFPDAIPEYAQEVEYRYLYKRTLDDEIGITLKYGYDSEASFEKERDKISQNQNVILEEAEGEKDTYYTVNSERVIFASFDNEQRTVVYGYFNGMKPEEIGDLAVTD